MNAVPPRRRPPLAGGFLIPLFILIGVAIGIWQGQPSIGFLAGMGAGIVLALLVWLLDARRS